MVSFHVLNERVQNDAFQPHVIDLSAAVNRISVRVPHFCDFAATPSKLKRSSAQDAVTMAFWYFTAILMVCDNMHVSGDNTNLFLRPQIHFGDKLIQVP